MTFVYFSLALTLWLLYGSPVRRQPFFSPMKMFLCGWFVVEGAYATGMIVYRDSIELWPATVLMAAKTAFISGALIVARSGNTIDHQYSAAIRMNNFDRLTLLVIAALSLAAGALVMVELLNVGAVRVSFFSAGGLADIRDQRWDEFYSGKMSSSPVRSISGVGAFCLASLLPYFLRQRRKLLSFLALLSCFVVVAESVAAAGRFAVALLALILIVCGADAWGKTRFTQIINFRIAAVGAIAVFYFFIVFPVQRNPNLPHAVGTYLEWIANANISPWILNLSRMPGLGWLPVFAYSSSYFSGALDKLNYFMMFTDIASWYEMGVYNFPMISQIGSIIGISDNGWLEVRMKIASAMTYVGLSTNPWATGLRDLIIDFGEIGSIVAMALIGIISQAVFDKSRSSHTFHWKILSAYVVVGAFIMSFIGPLQIRLVSNGVLFIGLLAGVRFVLASAMHAKVRYRAVV